MERFPAILSRTAVKLNYLLSMAVMKNHIQSSVKESLVLLSEKDRTVNKAGCHTLNHKENNKIWFHHSPSTIHHVL